MTFFGLVRRPIILAYLSKLAWITIFLLGAKAPPSVGVLSFKRVRDWVPWHSVLRLVWLESGAPIQLSRINCWVRQKEKESLLREPSELLTKRKNVAKQFFTCREKITGGSRYNMAPGARTPWYEARFYYLFSSLRTAVWQRH